MAKIEWKDLNLVCVFEDDGNSVHFDCYEITGHAQDFFGKFTKNIYEKKGATSSEHTTEDIKEAQTIFNGYVKWDACSHVYFGSEDGYIHMCGKESWDQVSEGLKRVFEYACKALVREHNKEYF